MGLEPANNASPRKTRPMISSPEGNFHPPLAPHGRRSRMVNPLVPDAGLKSHPLKNDSYAIGRCRISSIPGGYTARLLAHHLHVTVVCDEPSFNVFVMTFAFFPAGQLMVTPSSGCATAG